MVQMLEYRKAMRPGLTNSDLNSSRSSTPSNQTANDSAARHLTRGHAHVRALKMALQRSASHASLSNSTGSVASSPAPQHNTSPMTEAERHAAEQMVDERDKIAVEDEFQRYIEEGVIVNENELDDFSLTRYWQVRMISLLLLTRNCFSYQYLNSLASTVSCSCIVLHWIFFPFRPPLSHPKGFSHLAKKLVHFDVARSHLR